MSVQPALLIGIGDFGESVLELIARQVRQGYGPDARDRLAFLGFGFTSNSKKKLDPWVQHYNCSADISDWVRHEALHPALQGWCDASFLTDRETMNMFRELQMGHDIQDPRLARAVFIRHLLDNPPELHLQFFNAYEQLLTTYRKDKVAGGLMVYVFGAIHNVTARALLFDLVNRARWEVEAHDVLGIRIGSVIAYLSLMPPTGRQDITFDLAQSYAFLRELERYSTVGSAVPLYPEDSELERFNSNASRLIDRVRLSTQWPTSPSHLATMWADAVMAQLDPLFGPFWKEVLANLDNRKIEYSRRVKADENRFVVSTHEARSIELPLAHVQNQWSRRLFESQLRTRFRSELDNNAALKWLKEWAQKPELYNPINNQQVLCHPVVARYLLEKYQPSSEYEAYGTWCEAVTAAVSDETIRTTWNWLPHTFEHLQAYDPLDVDMFLNDVMRELKRTVGRFGIQNSDQANTFGRLLRRSQSAHYASFRAGILALIYWLLQEEHLAPGDVNYILRVLMAELTQAQAMIVADLEHRSSLNMHYDAALVAAGETIPRLIRRGWGNNPTRELQLYHNEVMKYANERRVQTLLETLHKTLIDFIRVVSDIRPLLDPWDEAFSQCLQTYDNDTTILMPLYGREDATTGHYVLSDENWSRVKFEQHEQKFTENLHQRLAWQMIQYPGTQDIAIYLAFDGRHVGEKTATDPHTWLRLLNTVIQDNVGTIDIWSYVLGNYRFEQTIPELEEFLIASQHTLPFRRDLTGAAEPSQYLLLPVSNLAEADQIESRLVETLSRQRGKLTAYHGHCRTQITWLAFYELIDVEQIDAFPQLRSAYDVKTDPAALHVLPGEAEAAKIVASLRNVPLLQSVAHLLPPHLGSWITPILVYPERLQQFIGLYYLDPMYSVELVSDRVATSLNFTDPDTGNSFQFWLTAPTPVRNDTEALLRFCLNQPYEPVVPLDYQIVDRQLRALHQAYVDERRQACGDDVDNLYPTAQYGQWAFQLRGELEGEWALEVALKNVRLDRLRQKWVDEMATTDDAAKRDMLMVLFYVASRQIDSNIRAIRDIMQQKHYLS